MKSTNPGGLVARQREEIERAREEQRPPERTDSFDKREQVEQKAEQDRIQAQKLVEEGEKKTCPRPCC